MKTIIFIFILVSCSYTHAEKRIVPLLKNNVIRKPIHQDQTVGLTQQRYFQKGIFVIETLIEPIIYLGCIGIGIASIYQYRKELQEFNDTPLWQLPQTIYKKIICTQRLTYKLGVLIFAILIGQISIKVVTHITQELSGCKAKGNCR